MKNEKQKKVTKTVDPFATIENKDEKKIHKNRSNIQRASGEFNSKTFVTKENKKSRRGFNIVVHKDAIDQFRRNYLKFLRVKQSSLTEFFRISVEYWKNKMLEEGNFVEIDDGMLSFISRKGARQKNSRTSKKSETASKFLNTSEETYNDYYSLIVSFLHKQDMEDVELFSVSYFFYDFVEFLSNEINHIIKEIK